MCHLKCLAGFWVLIKKSYTWILFSEKFNSQLSSRDFRTQDLKTSISCAFFRNCFCCACDLFQNYIRYLCYCNFFILNFNLVSYFWIYLYCFPSCVYSYYFSYLNSLFLYANRRLLHSGGRLTLLPFLSSLYSLLSWQSLWDLQLLLLSGGRLSLLNQLSSMSKLRSLDDFRLFGGPSSSSDSLWLSSSLECRWEC